MKVVIHTTGERPELLQRAQDSIDYGQIVVINNPPNDIHALGLARLKALDLDEYIAFIDDDDYVFPGALKQCVDAMKDSNVGVVFTDEQIVDINGKVLAGGHPRTVSYSDIYMSPTFVHHIALIRTDAVDRKIINDINKFNGIAADWLIVASALFNKGAIHIPTVGYAWTHHDIQITKGQTHNEFYKKNSVGLSNCVRALNTQGRKGLIEQKEIS
jgi:glycosyltransferase involved in cell wall biosynthesis